MEAIEGGVRIAVKAVPNARRSEIAGRLGERLKVRVAAPPEDGKANRAVCAVIAEAIGVRESAVKLVAGHSAAEKTVDVTGVSVESATAALLG